MVFQGIGSTDMRGKHVTQLLTNGFFHGTTAIIVRSISPVFTECGPMVNSECLCVRGYSQKLWNYRTQSLEPNTSSVCKQYERERERERERKRERERETDTERETERETHIKREKYRE